MSNRPMVNVNTILTSLTLAGIVWLLRSVALLQQDVAVVKIQQAEAIDRMASLSQGEKDMDRRVRDLEFKKHGDGL